MNWTTFWQIFALVPWCAIWLSVVVSAQKK